ncbi:MAG: patatin-like phospholipase family protein [Bacteroidales bacterium]|nr:patatin-like phospholipase family protein [Bacteroidales bacterium]
MNKNISLVLSSGGARGIAHIGAIEELEKQGFEIKSIAGTSMGALVGGMYAAGKLDVYKEWMCSLDKMDVFNLIDFTLSLNGLIKGEKILKEMKKIIPDRNIEDLPIPYSVVATDIINGKEVIFESGSLYDAIRASISIPTVFTPFNKNGLKLVDGGVLNPIPINRVKRQDNDILIVVNVGADKIHETPNIKETISEIDKKHNKYLTKIHDTINNIIPKNKTDKLGYYNLLNKTTSLMLQEISKFTLEKYKYDILIEIPKTAYGTYDFYKSNEIIELGINETKKALQKYFEK